MILTAPDDVVPGEETVVVLSVEPVDNEISTYNSSKVHNLSLQLRVKVLIVSSTLL